MHFVCLHYTVLSQFTLQYNIKLTMQNQCNVTSTGQITFTGMPPSRLQGTNIIEFLTWEAEYQFYTPDDPC